MGLLQAAYQTYESHAHLSGKIEEGKAPLTPLFHMVFKTQVEIQIDTDGNFLGAVPVAVKESRTIIPVTDKSANRTSKGSPHPLCDQLGYLAPSGGEKFTEYIALLTSWVQSAHTHPKAHAVLRYVQSGRILDDLVTAGIIAAGDAAALEESGIQGSKYEKHFVRWRVLPAPHGIKTACWEDETLFRAFSAFYTEQISQNERALCFVSGEEDIVCDAHPKGVVANSFGAKLVSANDNSGYTYRGRFVNAHEAYSLGYSASQKAHNALQWLVSNEGVFFGGRTFLCWNTEGRKTASPLSNITFKRFQSEPADFVGYKNQLALTLGSYRKALEATDHVVIAALEAATTGRLSITYFNELTASDFLDRVQHWYTSCCWESAFFGVQSPPLRQIIDCAFGTQRGEKIETDDRVLREHMQQVLRCVVDGQPIPTDIVQALASNASNLQIYTKNNREKLLTTACALIRRYRNDKANKEAWKLALDTDNKSRSYLFGRLLAIAEQVERSTYGSDEGRETNAIRMQAVFSQRPLYAWRVVNEKLLPYFERLQPGLRIYYKRIIGEIVDMLPSEDLHGLDRKLDDTYLIGYYHQRSELFRKKDSTGKDIQTTSEEN